MGYNYKQLNFQFFFLFQVYSLELVYFLPLSVPIWFCQEEERGTVADSFFPQVVIWVFFLFLLNSAFWPFRIKKWEKMREGNGQRKFLIWFILFWMVVMLSELWKYFKLPQPCATPSHVAQKEMAVAWPPSPAVPLMHMISSPLAGCLVAHFCTDRLSVGSQLTLLGKIPLRGFQLSFSVMNTICLWNTRLWFFHQEYRYQTGTSFWDGTIPQPTS